MVVCKNRHINLLFRQDIFACYEPQIEEIEPDKIDTLVLREIDECDPTRIYKFLNVSNSLNFVLVYKKKTLLLKINHTSEYQAVLKQISIADLVSDLIPTVTFIRFRNQEFIFKSDKNIFSLQKFIHGRFNKGNLEDYKRTLNCIRSYYRQCKTISERLEKMSIENIGLYDYGAYFFNALNQLQPKSLEGNLIKEKLNLKQSDISNLIDPIEFKKLTFTPCHIDLHPHNIILGDDKCDYIIDLASFKLYSIEISMSFALFKNFRNSASKENFSEADMRSVLNNSILMVFGRNNYTHRVLSLAILEYIRRANNVFWELERFGHSRWYDNLYVQLIGILEILHCSNLRDDS